MAGKKSTHIEVWKEIPGFDGFDVSSEGRVRSFWKTSLVMVGRTCSRPRIKVETPKVLNQSVSGESYARVSLHGKNHRVHVLVLTAFAGPRPAGREACHSDGNPLNNRSDNLYWGTPHQNALNKTDHGKNRSAKLSRKDVERLIALRKEGTTIAALSKLFGIGEGSVYRRLKPYGLPKTMKTPKLSHLQIEELCTLRRNGMTIGQLSERFRVGQTTVWLLITKRGFKPLESRFGRYSP